MKKKKPNYHLILLFLLVLSTFIIGIGYATINGINLNITGSASVAEDGDVKITSVVENDSSNVTENTPAFIINDGQGISFDLAVTVNADNYNDPFYIKYLISVTNDSLHEQRILNTTFTPVFTGDGIPPTTSFDITDLNGNSLANDTIPAKTSESYYLLITMHPQGQGSWGMEGETEVETGEVDTGTVVGNISGTTSGDLTSGHTRAHFTASVINSHDDARTFSLSINSNHFSIVDSNGNALSDMNIAANESGTYDFYIQIANNSKFMTTPQTINVYMTCDGKTTNIGTVSLTVDVDSTLTDFDAPVITSLTVEQSTTNKQFNVSWTATDDNTITKYYVQTYTSDASGNGTLYDTIELAANGNSGSTTITVPNDNAYYYFKVYGEDQTPNTATQAEIDSCSTSQGHCMRNNNQIYKWNYTVTLVLTNATSNSGTPTTNGTTRTYTYNVSYNDDLGLTLAGASNSYNQPADMSSAKITKPGQSQANLSTTSSDDSYYSYTATSGALNIYHIKGDIRIEASGSDASQGPCFAKGTPILLADGTYKNIEDIGYDDLLAVWNYDTGSLTYEYPLWIETEHDTDNITRVAFSDGSHIDFVGEHAIYNTDLKLFVNVQDRNTFNIGTHVAKLDNTNNLVDVEVISIEDIKMDTKYYMVGTTTYYNLFAGNNILTTDRNLMISNLYGFVDNAKWPDIKNQLLLDPNNLVSYEDMKDVLPYYLFEGFRVRELGFLINMGRVSLNEFKIYISTLITDASMIVPPINKNGSNLWMVTTDKDNIVNKNDFLKQEGSSYILPVYDNISGWYNTSDNKVYNPGDTIKVVHGLHFIGIEKND